MITYILNFIAKKIYLRKPIKKLFLNFIKNNRYNFLNYEFTFIQINKNNTFPDYDLKKITDKAFDIVIADYKNYINNNYNKELNQIYDFSNHYMLLKGIAETLKAKNIVEIGTASGLSLLSFLKSQYTQKVSTWDLYPIFPTLDTSNHVYNATATGILDPINQKNNPEGLYLTGSAANWVSNSIVQNHLETELHLNKEKYHQFIEDINEPNTFIERKDILENSDLIFIDAGSHDGIFEKSLYEKLINLNYKKNTILILDDIKVSSMVTFWESIDLPKLDISNIGHLTGTGIVRLS